MKKFLCHIVSAVFCFSVTVHSAFCVPVSAEAETITVDNVIYELDPSSNYLAVDVADKNITSVTIPAKINGADAYVIDNIFKECKNLEEITVEEGNEYNYSTDGVLFLPVGLLAYPPAKPDEEYTVPEDTNSILARAFVNCTELKTVHIPDSVTAAEQAMFEHCPNLEKIDGTLFIYGNTSILDCPSLKYLHLGGIYEGSFAVGQYPLLETLLLDEGGIYKCSFIVKNQFLKELRFPAGCRGIKINDCSMLENVTFLKPSQLGTPADKTISAGDWDIKISDCPELKEISFRSANLTINNLPKLETIICDDRTTSQKIAEVSGCDNVTVYGYSNDIALQNDCLKFNLPFVALNEDSAFCTGDLTGDTQVDIRDVIKLNQSVFGKITLTNSQKKAADVNNDGMADATDALLIMKYIVGLIDNFA